ncbi:metal-sulfur cluster biosynthetic enzyme [Halobacteriales archaeon QS_5_70_17]|nr:MAG: metal-sulfur cluster biosynthetic enzyme [Halobacteriales archaeon QS_5_70_17]
MSESPSGTGRGTDGERADPSRAAVRERLDRVTDPELDRSIVELEYVDGIEIDGPGVAVRFRLPTAWCSPAFAWMMATDIREEVRALSGVERVRVRLEDHLHGEEITEGVNEGRPFEAVFEDATEGVESVRAVLDDKARLARQHRAVEALLDAGLTPDQITGLDRGDMTVDGDRVAVALEGLTVFADADPVERYLAKATEVGVADAPDAPLFETPENEPIDPEEFDLVHRRTRLAKTNMGGQGALCDGLREARYAEGRPDLGFGPNAPVGSDD